MNHLSILHDDIKREICNRCYFLGAPALDGKVCARTGEAIVSLVAKQFSQSADVQRANPDEEVSVDLGGGAAVHSTKETVIEGLVNAEKQIAAAADTCTIVRSLQGLAGNIESFKPYVTYTREELMLLLSSEI